MAQLYILGAGASRNYSQPKHGIRGLKSPLNNDFFRMAKRVIDNTGMREELPFFDEVEVLIKTVAPMYGSKETSLDFFGTPVLNLEDVMSLLDIDFKLFSPNLGGPFRDESRQMRVLKDLLARTLDYALMGPPCEKHRALAEGMASGDVVLTFNYDILMDNALFLERKISDSAYCMSFSKTNEEGNWKRSSDDPSLVTLFKLHGSLNWVRCGFCGALLLYRSKKKALYGAMTFECPRCLSDETHAQRMMIPPVESKDYSDRNMAFLWVQADRLLRDFSRVVCIGYSFPYLDYDMLTLIRRFRSRQSQMPEVDFVSPDDEAESRLKTLLGVKEVRRFNSLSSYLKEIV